VLFSSYEFILGFLPAVLLAFHYSRIRFGGRTALIIVALASFFFYGWWNPPYLILLAGSMLANYLFARRLSEAPNTRLLQAGVLLNLCVLGYFKYRNFFLENISAVLGEPTDLGAVFVPLAISFFTFQQIALLIDANDGRAKISDWVDFTAFVALFPQLIAGPIVLFREIEDQFAKLKKSEGLGLAMFGPGLAIFSLGLFKKIVLADSIAPYVNAGYRAVETLTFLEAWAVAIAYSLQLYFDFCGYSDMAVGLALMLGIALPINFNTPFRATSMVDFWKRWHITMTRFFMMYLYSPIALALSRKSMENEYGALPSFAVAIALPIALTFLLSGLWHGAAWTFVAFGAVNAIGLIVNHAWREAKLPNLPSPAGWFLTMLTVLISFVYFRAGSMAEAHTLITAMFTPQDIVLPNWLAGLATRFDIPWRTLDLFASGSYTLRLTGWIALLFLLSLLPQNPAANPGSIRPTFRTACLTAGMLLISLGLLDRPQAFIYFQF